MEEILTKLKWIWPPCMILAGFLANSIGFVVFSRSFTRLRLRNLFRTIAIIDMINLLNFLLIYLEKVYSIRLRNSSEFLCRFLSYMYYVANSIAAWLLVCLSFNRFASLRINSTRVVIKKYGKIILFLIFLVNIGLYSVVLAFTSLNREKMICFSRIGTLWFHFGNLCCLILITVTVTLLNIHYVLKLKKKIHSECVRRSKRLAKNIHYVITTVVMNFLFVLFYLPVVVALIVEKNEDQFTLWLNILENSINGLHFYVLIVFNSFFRRECLVLFGITKKEPPPQKRRKNALVIHQIN